MKYSTRLSDAVHILAFIALNPNGSLSSSSIAESIHTNPGCVRQLMSALRRAGLISSVKGHPRPAVGIYIQLSLQDFFDQIQESAEKEMKSVTLQDILERYQEKSVHWGQNSP